MDDQHSALSAHLNETQKKYEEKQHQTTVTWSQVAIKPEQQMARRQSHSYSKAGSNYKISTL
jgi:hypothetical protein